MNTETTKDENKRGECPGDNGGDNKQKSVSDKDFDSESSSGDCARIRVGAGTEADGDRRRGREEHPVESGDWSRDGGDTRPEKGDEKHVRESDKSLLSEEKTGGGRDYDEKEVLQEVARLLTTPVFPEDADALESEEDMSRPGLKPKVPNKTVSRPSLSHVSSKLPGELSGQPSVKNTKEDIKYWKSREQELLDRIAALESKATVQDASKEKFHAPAEHQAHDKLQQDLSATTKEKENYKSRLHQIEKELFAKQKDQFKEPNLKGMKSPEEVIIHLKAQNEDLRGALAKMTAILRDKTALCVNQEKKVAALTNQVDSLKEVVAITKDLLNIRNMEVQHISNDIAAMESKIDCERQRHNQMLIKMDEAVKLNSELKKEYENQMKLFQHLRDNYEEKIRMISQNGCVEHKQGKDETGDQQRGNPLIGNGKTSQQVAGKLSKGGSNYKVNFQET